jgi:hypothetical protein
VTIAAMKSTSTYWKPPFYCLEEVMEGLLLNAAHMKAVPGLKADVRDAEGSPNCSNTDCCLHHLFGRGRSVACGC